MNNLMSASITDDKEHIISQQAPIVSVVITAFNRPDHLKTSVASALAQTLEDIEIIVVDDCSPVPLQPTVAEFKTPIQYIRLPRNSGANHARNVGIRAARGKYIAFLDDDDAWHPAKLQWQLDAIGDRLACIGGYEYMDNLEPSVKAIREVHQEMLKRGNIFCGMSGLLAQREWLLANPFDESLSNGQDWDMFVRLAFLGPMAYVARPLFRYRRGSHESITTKVKTMSVADLEKRLGAVKKHRAWLGERYYRLRIAQMFLGYIGSRKDPGKYIWMALSQGGLLATLRVLGEKVGNFLKRGGKATTH